MENRIESEVEKKVMQFEALNAEKSKRVKKRIEEILNEQPEDDEDERYMRRLVKAADKLSALIKCIEEEKSGNTEFKSAKSSSEIAVAAMAAQMPEVKDFVEEFLPPYGRTLDELS